MSEPVLTAEHVRGVVAARPRVVVIGDVILDGWWHGHAERMTREAPAAVVDLDERIYAPGGAANTAVNLAALGADVSLVALVGNDEPGERLLQLVRDAGVRLDGIVQRPDVATPAKYRVVGDDQVLVRIDENTSAPVPEAARRALEETALRLSAGADAELVCDYGSGSLDSGLIAALSARSERPALTLVDAHELARWAPLGADLVTPNAGETERLLGASLGAGPARRDEAVQRESELLRRSGARRVVVTLDRDGTVLLGGPEALVTGAHPAGEKQASGAGDTFAAALALATAAGLEESLALAYAQLAADVVVQQPGTSVCSSDDLLDRLAADDRVLDLDEAARRVAAWKRAGKRVVLTNGCFDVLHRGHTSSLHQAAELGDVLVVALNDDAAVRRLKGPDRPINGVRDRAGVLAALGCVDLVTVFETDTAEPVIRMLQPDVYAKGGDYAPEMLAETDEVRRYGGEVRMLDYVPAHSTSAVVQRIRGNVAGAAR